MLVVMPVLSVVVGLGWLGIVCSYNDNTVMQ